MRVKLMDIWIEPAKLKEERDQWKQDANALLLERDNWRLERQSLLERIAQLEQGTEGRGDHLDEVTELYAEIELEVVPKAQDDAHRVDLNVGGGVEQNVEGGVEQNVEGGVEENVEGGVEQNVEGGVDQNVVVANEPHALACTVAYEEFELFLKFKKFLNFERDQQEGKAADLQTSQEPAQPAQPDQPSQIAQDANGVSFMTLADGKVLEVINVGVF